MPKIASSLIKALKRTNKIKNLEDIYIFQGLYWQGIQKLNLQNVSLFVFYCLFVYVPNQTSGPQICSSRKLFIRDVLSKHGNIYILYMVINNDRVTARKKN